MSDNELDSLRTQVFEMNRFFLEYKRKLCQLIFIGVSAFFIALNWCQQNALVSLNLWLGCAGFLASILALVVSVYIARQHRATVRFGIEQLSQKDSILFRGYSYGFFGGGLVVLSAILVLASASFLVVHLPRVFPKWIF